MRCVAKTSWPEWTICSSNSQTIRRQGQLLFCMAARTWRDAAKSSQDISQLSIPTVEDTMRLVSTYCAEQVRKSSWSSSGSYHLEPRIRGLRRPSSRTTTLKALFSIGRGPISTDGTVHSIFTMMDFWIWVVTSARIAAFSQKYLKKTRL